jgi:hypothetical protein
MGETSLMTAEELLRLNLPDKRTELIRGRLVVRDPGGARHWSGRDAARVPNNGARAATRFRPGLRRRDGLQDRVGSRHRTGAGRRVHREAPGTEIEPLGYHGWAPHLAVEVLAHDDHPAETLSEALLGPNETLDGEDVLPGFRCPLAALW